MIMTRSPLRITLGGGGTDLPSYYREHEGFVVSAAINQYVYITIHQAFRPYIMLKYSKLEEVETVDQIVHPIVRESLKHLKISGPHLEIVSLSDIPAGTGLGSSGSFTTALLRALHTLRNDFISPQELAEEACEIEITKLQAPIGKQDQYIAAFGGITAFHFCPDGHVEVEPVRIPPEALANLEDNLILFFTGYTRSASDLLHDQDARTKKNDSGMLANLHFVKQLGIDSRDALQAGDLNAFAELMHRHWLHKRERSPGMSNSHIDDLYELGRRNGAAGGKLIGAGGGGFLLFYAENKTRLRRAMREAGLRELRMQFDFAGTSLMVNSWP